MTTTPSVSCGDASPNGNVALTFKGGCGKDLPMAEAFRCTGCGGWFHHACIFEHFEQEDGHSRAHVALHKIREYVRENGDLVHPEVLLALCHEGLDRQPPSRSLLPI